MSDPEAELKEKLCIAHRILAMEGQGDASMGHMSARLPGADHFWMKPRALGLVELTPDDLVALDFQDRKIAGQRGLHSERFIHSELLRARPEVMAVVHTHPLYATVLGATDLALRPVIHQGTLFFPPIPRFDLTTDLIITRERGEAVARVLGDRNAVFLKNHGIAVVGRTIEEACLLAVFLEQAAKAQLLALAAVRYSWTPDEEVLIKRDHIFSERQMHEYWEYFRRKAERWDGVSSTP